MCNKKEYTPRDYRKDLVDQIKTYFSDQPKGTKAIIGMSGGKDSTVCAALLVEALGAENVIGVLIPNKFMTVLDSSIATEVCESLGMKYYTFNIGSACEALYSQFGEEEANNNSVITTNTPARLRMTVLYMFAAANNGRVINTSNASETYIGYSTKYGDSAGDFAVLKKYSATEVYAIGETYVDDEILAFSHIHTIPSDGMSGKSDEEKLGFTYKELDDYLLNGIVPNDVEHFRLIKAWHEGTAHKRRQMPECTRICAAKNISYGGDWDF